MENSNELLTCDQAAKQLALSKSTLAKMRLRGDGPIYVKLGPRRVAYREKDLEVWVAKNRFQSTSQYEA